MVVVIIVSARRLAFIHVPKTGGSSIAAALRHIADDPGGAKAPVGAHGWQIGWHHGALHNHDQQMCALHGRDLRGWRIACFVRSPWSLMESLYAYSRIDGETFPEFCRRWRDEPKTIGKLGLSAVGKWFIGGGFEPWTRHCNFVGKFEHLERDFRHMVGEPAPPLEHYNTRAAANIMTKVEHTAETIDIIGKWWRDDIERWGYEPPCTT